MKGKYFLCETKVVIKGNSPEDKGMAGGNIRSESLLWGGTFSQCFIWKLCILLHKRVDNYLNLGQSVTLFYLAPKNMTESNESVYT